MRRRVPLIVGGLVVAVGAVIAAAAIGNSAGTASAEAAAAAIPPVTVSVTETETSTATKTLAPVTETVTETATETVTAPPPAPVTETVTVTESANAPTSDPAGPKRNGTYLVGSQIASGQWQCPSADSIGLIYFETDDSAGEIIDNDVHESSLIAFVGSDAYSVEFSGCGESWTKVG
jgi:hypothetical protein